MGVINIIRDLIRKYNDDHITILSISIGEKENEIIKNYLHVNTPSKKGMMFGIPFIVENEWGIFISGLLK
jgi:hypothetical protein